MDNERDPGSNTCPRSSRVFGHQEATLYTAKEFLSIPPDDRTNVTAVYFASQAVGAHPNGSIVEKVNSKQGDATANGTRGVVIGSIGPFDLRELRPGLAEVHYMYSVMWEGLRVPVVVTDHKVRAVDS